MCSGTITQLNPLLGLLCALISCFLSLYTPSQLQSTMWPFTKDANSSIPPGKGRFHVGCSDIMSDHTIDGSFCRLYYPTDPPSQEIDKSNYATWLPSKDYASGYAKYLGFNFSAPVATMLFNFLLGIADFKVPAIWNAPLADTGEKLPILVFSHGLGACRTTYSSTCVEFASRGFLVAAVEHRDRSACATYIFKDVCEEDETSGASHVGMVQDWIPHYFTKPSEDFELRNNQVTQRAQECTTGLNLMEKIHKGEEIVNATNNGLNTVQFKGRLDLDKVAIAGHSFGGATSLVSLVKDDRFKFGVVFDAWLYPIEKSMYSFIQKPILFINTEKFHWPGNIARMHRMVDDFDNQTEDRIVITILGTVHQSQTDFALLVKPTMGKLLRTCGTLQPEVAIDINNGAAVAFICRRFGVPYEEQLESFLTGENENVLVGTNVKLDPTYKKSGEKDNFLENSQGKSQKKTQANLEANL